MDSVYSFWFQNNKKWFASTPEFDELIHMRYGELLTWCENASRRTLLKNNTIAAIIVLDQFSRHIYRNTNRRKITFNTLKACDLSRYYMKYNRYLKLKPTELVFALMPFKHDILLLHFSMIKRIVTHYVSVCGRNPLVIRFYKDTLKKYCLLKNKLVHNQPSEIVNRDIDYTSICDFNPHGFMGLCYNPNLYLNSSFKQNRIVKSFEKYIQKSNLRDFTISLSGGVDSMIMTFILAHLRRKYCLNVCACHINYNNRPESSQEAEFVKMYCAMLQVPLVIRSITDVKRNDTILDRNDYEKITKAIRFDIYKMIGNPVILGHNYDDVVENIVTNFFKGKFIFNLFGMKFIDMIDDVLVCRPLLKVEKSVIYEFSAKYNIAYLKNTTPTWSNRGKMRNEFLPAIERQFGRGYENNLLYIAKTLSKYEKCIQKHVVKPFMNSIERIDKGYILDIGGFETIGVHFWKQVFEHILPRYAISRKSIKNLISHFNKKSISVDLNGRVKAHLLDKKLTIIVD
jgi:tRNA(Ile)-lysidine synthetase-like protein